MKDAELHTKEEKLHTILPLLQQVVSTIHDAEITLRLDNSAGQLVINQGKKSSLLNINGESLSDVVFEVVNYLKKE